jgi:hypothetical protein
MVKVYRFFAYFIFFIVMLLLFFPKEQLYFAFEKELQNEHLVISNEQYNQKLLSLELREAELSFDRMRIATISKLEIRLLFLYNSVKAEDIELSKILKRFLPQKIATIELHYTLIEPFVLKGSAFGDFGEAMIVYNLQKSKLSVRLKASKLMKQHFHSTLLMLKKEDNGEYSYEKSF